VVASKLLEHQPQIRINEEEDNDQTNGGR